MYRKIFFGRQSPYVIFTMALVSWLICIPLFMDGMFMDGLIYASVSRNLARGIGTFWNPVFSLNSVAGISTFHEHPPLVFFLQSLFFRIFGLHNIYPERMYSLFTFLLTALFIALIWRRVLADRPGRDLWWLPILLWTIMPIVFWAYADNLQENTMTVFTSAAIYFFLCATDSGIVWRSPGFYAGCVCIVLAMLSKGIPGIFPAAFFFIYDLSVRQVKLRSAIIDSLVVGLFLIAAWILLLLNPVARESMHTWFFDRMLSRISHDPVSDSHFYILIGLFTEQIPAMAAVAAVLTAFKLKKVPNEYRKSYFLLFLLLGLAGSLPLMLTLVQRDFYFIPSLPLFCIAWGLLIADGVQRSLDYVAQSRIRTNVLTLCAWAALLAGISVTVWQTGKMKRDKEMLHDVYCLQKLIPPNTFVTIHSDILWNWSVRCYMMRYNSISFTEKDTCPYLMAYPTEQVDAKYVQTSVPLYLYRLYKMK